MSGKSWQRFIWLMTITVGFIVLIAIDGQNPLDKTLIGVLGGVIGAAAKQFFDQSHEEKKLGSGTTAAANNTTPTQPEA